jgi:hypothetical protein
VGFDSRCLSDQVGLDVLIAAENNDADDADEHQDHHHFQQSEAWTCVSAPFHRTSLANPPRDENRKLTIEAGVGSSGKLRRSAAPSGLILSGELVRVRFDLGEFSGEPASRTS